MMIIIIRAISEIGVVNEEARKYNLIANVIVLFFRWLFKLADYHTYDGGVWR